MSVPHWILALPKELAVIIVASLPIFELRGAIPLGVSLGLPLVKVYFLALLGNFLPVVPLLVFFKYFFQKLHDIKFFRWWFSSVERRSRIVERWGFWGLIIFVAIPLPITGAWTGTVAATLFEIRPRRAVLAIITGVAIAGIIVSFAVGGVIKLWSTFI